MLRKTLAAAVVSAVLLAAPSARAEFQLGGTFQLKPWGSMTSKLPLPSALSATEGTAVAYGLSAYFDWFLIKYLSLGLSPQVTFNLRKHSEDVSATQIDILARVALWIPATDSFRIYAYGAPGYSFMERQNQGGTPNGFVVNVGAGFTYTIIFGIYLSLEGGYSFGFQKLSGDDCNSRLLHVSAGVGLRI